MAMLALGPSATYTKSYSMKQLYVIGTIVLALIVLSRFDTIVVFLLSGFIPVIGISVAPSTMLAIMTASIILTLTLVRYRRRVYARMLAFYDQHFASHDNTTATKVTTKTRLPRRRYGEI